jgi:peptidoglycan DL-endopeptidase CwlO
MRSGNTRPVARPGSRARRAGAGILVVLSLGFPQLADASTSDERAEVERIADQIEALENQLGQLEEDHAAALDRLDELTITIQAAQATVDAQAGQIAKLQGQLTDIALDKFITGGSATLTPLFSSPVVFSDDLQRNEFTRVALDEGAGTTDEWEALLDDYTAATQDLQAKQTEQAALIADLERRQAEGDALAAQLDQAQADAEARLGQAIIEEQERRLAQQIAAAQAREAERQRAVAPTARGGGAGGGNTGGGTGGGGGGDNGGDSGGGGGQPAPDPGPSVPPPSSKSGIAVGAAQSQLGVPYRFARSEPGVAFDCSGLTKYAWGQAGVYLPHQSGQQYASTPHVPKEEAQPGDLIFYHSPIGHVGIYIGGGSLIHAPATGDVVKVSAVRWNKVVGVSRPG